MSTPNPLAPQGSLLEQQAKSKSSLQVAALIVGVHVVVLGGFLILGCSKEVKKDAASPITDSFANPLPAAEDTNLPAIGGIYTNAAPLDTGVATNSAPPLGVPPSAEAAAPSIPDANPAPGPAASGSEYKIQKGDIAYVLAKKHGVSLKALKDANPNTDLAKLKVGQVIQMPGASAAPEAKSAGVRSAASEATGGATAYTVKGGDNLTKIAKKFGTTVKAIRSANGLKGNDIKAGQKLKIPGKAAAAAAAPVPVQDHAPAPGPTAAPIQLLPADTGAPK